MHSITRNILAGISLILMSFVNYAEDIKQPEQEIAKITQQQTPQQRLSARIANYQKICSSDECHEQLIQLKKYGRWGDAKSQLVLGSAYLYGDGVEQDTDKAISWLKRVAYNTSSNAGKYSLHAFNIMAQLYQKGIGVDQDKTLANKYLNKLAEKNYGPVLFDRAFIEFDQNNITEGITLLEQASNNRFAEASYYLARMYQQGNAIEKDINKAAIYYEKIVRSDYKDSRQRLAQIITEIEAHSASLTANAFTQEQALVKQINATLDIEVITVNAYSIETQSAMTNLLTGLRVDRGRFTPATGTRIRGRSCSQTSNSCKSMTEEEFEDRLNETSISID